MGPEKEIGDVVEELTKIFCDVSEKVVQAIGVVPAAMLETVTWGEVRTYIETNRAEIRRAMGAAGLVAVSLAIITS